MIDTFNETIQEEARVVRQSKTGDNEHLQKVKVAMLELGKLGENFRGDITEDVYLNRRKKLRMDLVVARDEVSKRRYPRLVKDAKDKRK